MEVVGAHPQEQQKLKEITGLSPDVLRQRWLSAISAPKGPSGTKPMPQDSLDRMLKAANLEAKDSLIQMVSPDDAKTGRGRSNKKCQIGLEVQG